MSISSILGGAYDAYDKSQNFVFWLEKVAVDSKSEFARKYGEKLASKYFLKKLSNWQMVLSIVSYI